MDVGALPRFIMTMAVKCAVLVIVTSIPTSDRFRANWPEPMSVAKLAISRVRFKRCKAGVETV